MGNNNLTRTWFCMLGHETVADLDLARNPSRIDWSKSFWLPASQVPMGQIFEESSMIEWDQLRAAGM